MDDTQIPDIGARLKARRLELGFSIKDVAERTRIRKVYLESLEDNQFEALPGKIYVSGFLKAYACCLDYDPAPLLNDLHALQDDSGSTEKKVEASRKDFSPQGWGVFFVGFLVVLLIGAAIFFLPAMFKSSAVEETASVTIVEKATVATEQALQSEKGELKSVAEPDATPPSELKAK